MANPMTDFLTSLEDVLEAYRIAHNDFLLGIMDAMRQLAEDLDEIPGPGPDPIPEPEPPAARSVFGWNANHCLYWSNGRPWNDVAKLTSIHARTGSQFSVFGELTAGEGLLPIWLDPGMAQPGKYRVATPFGGTATPAEFELTEDGGHQQFNITLRGDCRGLIVRRDGNTSTTLVTPEAIARHRNAAAIRLMDLRHTNTGEERHGNHYRINSQANPPIIEQTVTPYLASRLAEESGGTPIWWNFHHLEDDRFIRDVCNEFNAYGGSWKIYFEMSNEVWNGAFPVGSWADEQMGEPQEGRYKWLNQRTREMSAICKEILGERAIVVIGSQCTNLGVTQKVLAGGVDGLDALSVGAYFNWFLAPPPTFAEALQKIREHLDTAVYPSILAQQELAAEAGLRGLLAYEAGTDLSYHNNPAAEALYTRLNESDEVAQIYEEFCEFWEDEVGDVCLFFQDTNHTGYQHYRGERLGPLPKGNVVQERIANV